MTNEEMLKYLDLDAKPTPGPGPETVRIESQPISKPSLPQGDNALVLDRWTKRQGRQLHKRLKDEQGEKAIPKPRPIFDMDAVDLADLHHSVFDPTPELTPEGSCSDRTKYKYFNELMDTPGFHELRQCTVLDDVATDLAIERLAEGLATLRNEKKEKGEGEGEGEGDDDDFGIGRVAGKSVNEAQQDVNDLNNARDGLGLGREAGSGGQFDVKATLDIYKKLRQDVNLQKIINLAGKYRLFGQSQQRRKVAHGYDDMVGVTIGNSLPRLTQSEFMALGVPELEDDVCRRLLDSQAMVQEWRGQEPVAKGPMILCIDESGSMTNPSGDGCSRIQHAKALALSFAYLARQQGRWCSLVGWSSRFERRSIVLAPGKWDQEALINWLSGFFCGGTEPPVSDMPEIYTSVGAPEGKTDIVYITDGTVYIPHEDVSRYNTWKQEVQAKVITLVVSASPGEMTLISDEIHCIHNLGLNEATARVLSI